MPALGSLKNAAKQVHEVFGLPCPGSGPFEFVAQEIEPPLRLGIHDNKVTGPACILGIFLPLLRLVGLGGQNEPAEIGLQKGAGERLPAAGGFAGTGAPEDLNALKSVAQGPEILRQFFPSIDDQFEQGGAVIRPVFVRVRLRCRDGGKAVHRGQIKLVAGGYLAAFHAPAKTILSCAKGRCLRLIFCFVMDCQPACFHACMQACTPATMRAVHHACQHPRMTSRKPPCQPASLPAIVHASTQVSARACGEVGRFFPRLTNSGQPDGNGGVVLV